MKRMGKIAGMLAALALAGGLTIGMTGTARANVVPQPPWSEIFPTFTNQLACLDDPNGSATPNTHVQLWHCHGYATNGGPQRWVFGLWGTLSQPDAAEQAETEETWPTRPAPSLNSIRPYPIRPGNAGRSSEPSFSSPTPNGCGETAEPTAAHPRSTRPAPAHRHPGNLPATPGQVLGATCRNRAASVRGQHSRCIRSARRPGRAHSPATPDHPPG